MRWLTRLLLLLAALQAGAAVKCYRCVMGDPKCGGAAMDLSAVLTENCTLGSVATGLTESMGEDKFATIEREAGIGSFNLPETTAASIPLGCLKVEKTNTTTGEVLAARHCIWMGHDDVDACAAIRASDDVTFCSICDYDLCNGAPSARLVALPAAALVVALLR